MTTDHDGKGSAGFEAAEEHRREASLSASASERLRWLEEALRFAWKVGALPKREDERESRETKA